MERMNLFGDNDKSSEALFNDAGAKSYKALFTNKGESSEAPFKYKQGKINITDDVINESAVNNYRIILSANNKLYFSIGDTKYIVDLYNEDARKECRLKLNEDTGRDFNWFKEETGLNNWVLYDSKMYAVEHDGNYLFLHYIEDCGKDPIIPINASSCHRMFSNYKILTELDFNSFSTVNVIIMDYMFADSLYFEHLDLSSFNTANFRTMKSQGAAKNEANNAAQETKTVEKIDFSKVKVEPLFEEMVDFDTFSKSDFRAVKVKACEAVKKSKKLLQFTLDDGTGTDRTILSGIHAYYEPEELVGKTLIAITNLPPRAMMGIDSCGMLLSAIHEEEGEEKLHLLMVDDHIPAGAKLY